MKLEAKTMSLSGLGIAYFVLGCLLPALVAELYYLLWWKKRSRTHTEIDDAKGFLSRLFRKTPSSTPINVVMTSKAESKSSNEESDLELGLKESVESELMRIHNLAGPPRFLFTIKEETKEDLESEDGKSKLDDDDNQRDVVQMVKGLCECHSLGESSISSRVSEGLVINPLFEPDQLNRSLISSSFSSSPPPKFKFLRDAEEKMYRRMIEEAQKNKNLNGCVSESEGSKKICHNSDIVTDYRDGSFLRLIKNKERREIQIVPPQFPSSSSSQVLPLASSPTTFNRQLLKR